MNKKSAYFLTEDGKNLLEYMKALNIPDLSIEEAKLIREHFRSVAELLVEQYLENKKGKGQLKLL